ncbi:DUF4260 domain-containing protein [Xanthomarina sp. GH4-25]|uniref:DUF4260 domain-containing protein n=1 Tax=Xanthomarina sp. GH4-25 TaxID=3349335 RepID=UPI0038783613
MRNSLKLEEVLMFVFGVLAFNQLDFAWWWFLVLILLPDVSMLGYLINSKIGAFTYNVFHHKGVAIGVYLLGVYFQNEMLQLIGIILFTHASMDRVFGYGMKFTDGFKHTHLGKL